MTEIEKTHEKWKIEQCEKIRKAATDKEKWKGINKLTNSDIRFDIQPIRKVDTSTKKTSYLFKDEDILSEMEDYDISKKSSIHAAGLRLEIEKLKEENNRDASQDWMNVKLSRLEIESTLGLCSGAAGPDGTHANLLDKAGRLAMTEYLDFIWNQAWNEGILH